MQEQCGVSLSHNLRNGLLRSALSLGPGGSMLRKFNRSQVASVNGLRAHAMRVQLNVIP
jgi:hypothetical protein